MKIVSGLGSIDEYIPFVKAGADEFFCGYVPLEWSRKYGTIRPLNRREVMNYNVQVGSLEELKILKNMMECYGVPVKLTLNSLYYSGTQYEEIAQYVDQCMQIGFSTFIIADPALILYLRQLNIPCRIHLSGECAEINSIFLEHMDAFDIQRVIFHRKNSIADMHSCVVKCKGKIPEYEAFFLNELCHFTGAYCNSLHCDEFAHLCHVPYELGKYNADRGITGEQAVSEEEKIPIADEEDGYVTGATGCGLCALYDLADAGITHLKIVGRGNYTEYARKDIMQTKRALTIREEVKEHFGDKTDKGRAAYIERIRKELFTNGCMENCYYRGEKIR